MQVVPYTPEHADEMRAVCLATASERARTEDVYRDFTLAMYCDPYLEHGTAFMLLDDDGVARGYTLGSKPWPEWKRLIAPYREKIRAMGPEFAERVERELAYYDTVVDRYPAHLHIDIEEPFTGGGNGRRLMEALLNQMRADGIKGVSFGVAANNTRAVGFYRHMGFKPLVEYEEEGEGGVTFCMTLN